MRAFALAAMQKVSRKAAHEIAQSDCAKIDRETNSRGETAAR